MNVLVLNCGSSSLKYQLINAATETALATGICERIGIDGKFKYKSNTGAKVEKQVTMETHETAVKCVLDALVEPETGVIKSLDEIGAVGHRVVHGGESFAQSVVIDDEVIKAIEACSDLAPLHNPANLIGINACKALMPNVPMVAVFDTAFHQSMPARAYLYGLPCKYYDEYKIRKYGFHGTSHSFVSKRMAEFAGLDINNSKIIVCHLGNGASVTAVLNGKSIDTSMGLTPLEGLTMGTRSGDIDPAIIEYIVNKEGKTVSEVIAMLNKESGVQGMSGGLSSDFRDLTIASEEGNVLAIQALEVYSYRVAKYIGSYVAAMNGVDAIAFTAGIGENDDLVRANVVGYLGYLGITLDKEKNNTKSNELYICTPDSKVKVAIIPTNEELAIARETMALI
ncbi:acetate/propionate family kinase [Anaerosporobacter sp.]|uniref:acetate/propionate family kinase n=1 Tax=Anaerosporobacter sp. TaxID=1872529 RepID=UPI00286F41B7|nr:acetate kinase [Anaerosporobacter sp.]